MIAPVLLSILLAAQAASDAPPLSPLPTQQLPASGCAAFLWTGDGTRTLIAMATADPAQLRLSLGGAIVDLARVAGRGDAGLGFAGSANYGSGDVTATLDLTIALRGDIKQGAPVPEGTLRVDRKGRDGVALPVVGLIGCARTAGGGE